MTLQLAERTFGLPSFPWDALASASECARRHPDGMINLSIGSPVDDTPEVAQRALAQSTNWPSYPQTIGTPALRSAIVAWARRRNITLPGPEAVLPTIGSKEAVALVPWQLGVGPGDRVVLPACAYPTYDVSARLARAVPTPVPEDPSQWPSATLAWINYPGNPNGHVASISQLRNLVKWAREHGTVLISDECYAPLGWRSDLADGVPSLLDDRVTDGDHTGLLMLYSLSKQSNFAGYRGALIAGDTRLVDRLIQIRKHSGLILPGPIQESMARTIADTDHVQQQRELYRSRRQHLVAACAQAGLRNDPDSVAGLYLWLQDSQGTHSGWDIVNALAKRGIVVAPGDFYGSDSGQYVRMALTASDDKIAQACQRLTESPLF